MDLRAEGTESIWKSAKETLEVREREREIRGEREREREYRVKRREIKYSAYG